jgi:hypothetical protein
MSAKMRPHEIQRQTRLMHLLDWGRVHLREDDLDEPLALQRLTQQAQGEFGVTYQTALGYSRAVMYRLRLERKRELTNV